jgi:hypothetical protein
MSELIIACPCRSIVAAPVLVLLGLVTRTYPTYKHKSFAWAEAAQQTPPLTACQDREAASARIPMFFADDRPQGLSTGVNLQKRPPPKQPDSGNAPYTELNRPRPGAAGFAGGNRKMLTKFCFSEWQCRLQQAGKGSQRHTTSWFLAAQL